MAGKIFKLYLQFLAALSLIGAGSIHSFPRLWRAWDEQIKHHPIIHPMMGGVALFLGVASLVFCVQEIASQGRR